MIPSRVKQLLSRREDDGSALILALLVLMVVGVIMASLLSFARTGLAFAPDEKQQRNLNSYTEGSVEAAIASIRSSSTFGRTGRPCPDLVMPGTTSADAPGASGHTYTIRCTPKPAASGPAGPDQPDYAILTLGPAAAGNGINQPDGGSNALLTVDGGIYSNGVITVDGSGNSKNRMQVNGDAFAEGDCTLGPVNQPTTNPPRLVTVGGGKFCNYSDTSGIGDDPQYAPAVNSSAALATLISSNGADPTPTCSSGRAEFTPGYYTVNPTVLLRNTLPALSCRGTSVYHFAPGKYVFDYNGLWELGPPTPVQVIAGTLNSAWSSGDPMGNACLKGSLGAQFIFGDASRVQVDGGASGVVVCGPTTAQNFTGSPQHIALYGLSANANNGTVNRQDNRVPAGKLQAASNPSPGGSGYSNPANARVLNETPPLSAVSATIPRRGTATLTYSSFDQVPAGSTINSITLRVGHTVTNASAAVTLKTSSQPGGQSYDLPNVCTPYCDVPVALADITQAPAWKDLNSLTATYTATGPSGNGQTGTSTVDGVQIIVDYTPPALVAQSCAGAGCYFFNSSVNPNVFFHGTVYVPSAALNVNVHNSGETIFDRGVISRTITIQVSASSKQTDSPFQIPQATPLGRRVLFTAYRDGNFGQPWARACVFFQDVVKFADGTVGQALPGYRAQVLHWSALRSPDIQDPACT